MRSDAVRCGPVAQVSSTPSSSGLVDTLTNLHLFNLRLQRGRHLRRAFPGLDAFGVGLGVYTVLVVAAAADERGSAARCRCST